MLDVVGAKANDGDDSASDVVVGANANVGEEEDGVAEGEDVGISRLDSELPTTGVIGAGNGPFLDGVPVGGVVVGASDSVCVDIVL